MAGYRCTHQLYVKLSKWYILLDLENMWCTFSNKNLALRGINLEYKQNSLLPRMIKYSDCLIIINY